MTSCCTQPVASGFPWETSLSRPVQNKELNRIFEEVHRKHFARLNRRVEARFYPYRSLRHTVEWNTRRISARVSMHFKHAPRHILEILALILFSKVYRQKVQNQLRKIYRIYSQDLQRNLPVLPARSLERYQPYGKYHNLEKIFKELNHTHFNDQIYVAKIGWSIKKSYRRIGFYDTRRKLLVISNVFDNHRVPVKVVEFLVYHEMLHVVIPEQVGKSRRILHPPEFRRLERAFPDYFSINRWIKANLSKL